MILVCFFGGGSDRHLVSLPPHRLPSYITLRQHLLDGVTCKPIAIATHLCAGLSSGTSVHSMSKRDCLDCEPYKHPPLPLLRLLDWNPQKRERGGTKPKDSKSDNTSIR